MELRLLEYSGCRILVSGHNYCMCSSIIHSALCSTMQPRHYQEYRCVEAPSPNDGLDHIMETFRSDPVGVLLTGVPLLPPSLLPATPPASDFVQPDTKHRAAETGASVVLFGDISRLCSHARGVFTDRLIVCPHGQRTR